MTAPIAVDAESDGIRPTPDSDGEANARAVTDAPPEPQATDDDAPSAPIPSAASASSSRPGLPGETPFAPWIPGRRGDRDVLDGVPGQESARRVHEALIAGVEAEGPIEIDRLVRLVASGFDLHRVVAARHAAILAQLPAGLARDPAGPEFAWPPSLDPLAWAGFRRSPDGVERPLEHISPREVGNTVVALCGAAAGMTQEQLWVGTLEIFGFTRRRATQVSALESALGLVLDSGRLTRRADGY